MKYLLTLAFLGSTLALTACGGSSDSSGSESANDVDSAADTCLASSDCGSDTDTSGEVDLASDTCLAGSDCGSDTDTSGEVDLASDTCLVGSDCGSDTDSNACPILGGIVNVTAQGCTYSSPNIQSSSNLWTCADGKVTTPGSVSISAVHYTDDNYTVQCAS